MANRLIKTNKLCKTFSNGGVQQHVLKNVDVEIYQEDFTVIMGSSGSGKSTLLYAISGMDKPTLDDMRLMAIANLNVMIGMIIVFALIIIGIVLVVIRFKIKEYIETNMQNIGSLQAMGYTTRQLIQSIAYEMFIVGSVAAVLGTIGAYMLMTIQRCSR